MTARKWLIRNNRSSLPGLMKQYAGVVEACEREREINNLVCPEYRLGNHVESSSPHIMSNVCRVFFVYFFLFFFFVFFF